MAQLAGTVCHGREVMGKHFTQMVTANPQEASRGEIAPCCFVRSLGHQLRTPAQEVTPPTL